MGGESRRARGQQSDLDEILRELNSLGGPRYAHAVMVLTSPPWGLGPLALAAGLLELMWPPFSALNALNARLLARTADGDVHEWALVTSTYSGRNPTTADHFIADLGPCRMDLRGGGLFMIKASWGNRRGWISRRDLPRWLNAAGR